jgi:hypothetical protein
MARLRLACIHDERRLLTAEPVTSETGVRTRSGKSSRD